MNYNRVILGGNITRDIEVRYLPTSNTAVASFGIAINRKWKDSSGELKEEVTFVDCEAFGKTAENIGKFFSKGKPILVEGRLRLDAWKDKTDGSNRSKLKVVIDTFEFVGGKDDREERPATANRNTNKAVGNGIDDDFPFA